MKISRKTQKAYIISMFLVSLILAAAGTSAVYAKYVKDVPFSGNVTVQANLVDTFVLFEHNAERTALGDYSLGGTEVSGNEYVLMPGVDIKKDPQIRITGKTEVPAYLYIEVVDTTPGTVTYSIESCWSVVADVTGPHGGSVYVYTPKFTTDMNIKIIVNDILTVKDSLVHPVAESYSLDFYAYMAQVPNAADTPAAVFAQSFTNTNN